MKIAPSILACDFSRLAEEIQAVERGGADWIHVDVMDGHFVPTITIGPLVTQGARRATSLPLDVHLMVENPDAHIDAFVEAGAAYITVHVEACRHLHRTVQNIRAKGVKAGVAINPATPVEALVDIVPEIDLLLIMSVNPGFGGQSFIASSLDRVRRARTLLDAAGSSAELEVDGGVSSGNILALAEAGASVVVAGSSVYRHADGPAEGVRAVRAALTP